MKPQRTAGVTFWESPLHLIIPGGMDGFAPLLTTGGQPIE
jgi:hypothetical protein